MTTDYPTDTAPATPEYVLEILRGWHRDGLLDDEPRFDMPIRELATILNDTIVFWWELANRLNAYLEFTIPVADWKPVLRPMGRRTVRNVCAFAAARMGTRPVIRPWRFVAGECRPAGAFLTIRSLLVGAGADPAAVTPSATVAPFVRENPVWLAALFRIAPSRVPAVAVTYRPWWVWLPVLWVVGPIALLLVPLGGILLILAATAVNPVLALAAAGMIAAGVVGLRWAARIGRPTGMAFDRPYTFRDLAYALTGQPPRRSIQPTS